MTYPLTSRPIAFAAHTAGKFVRPPAPRTWIERLARLGLVVRGLIYFVPGAFALEWALGRHRQPMTQASVIDLIGKQPLGRGLLVIVAVGLAGYAAWGVIRTILDPLRRGRSPAGIALRIGYATSAVAYTGLLIATLRLLGGGLARVAPTQDWSIAMLARPFGGVIVAGIGLCWIFGSGVAQIATGWSRTFERDLRLERMSGAERRWAVGLGRVGLVARGLVFTVIGILLVAAALRVQPRSEMGLEGALTELAHQPYGKVLVGLAGLGLMTFGCYSAMCARWLRMRADTTLPGSHTTRLPSK